MLLKSSFDFLSGNFSISLNSVVSSHCLNYVTPLTQNILKVCYQFEFQQKVLFENYNWGELNRGSRLAGRRFLPLLAWLSRGYPVTLGR